MNLHLVDDEKFINGAIALFEKYSPNENIFVVDTNQKCLQYITLNKNVIILSLSKTKDIIRLNKIVGENKIINLYVHFLNPLKAVISNQLKKTFNVKTFWIFYGADLYGMLHNDFGYSLYDEVILKKTTLWDLLKLNVSFLKFYFLYKETSKKATLDFIQFLDFFCFWNTYDYQLLKKYYATDAILIPFIYFNAIDRNLKGISPKNDLKIIVNNSASTNGNHATILKKISLIDKKNEIMEVIAPLSYGCSVVRTSTMELGFKLFGFKFNPLLDYLDKEDYFDLLDDVSVAFYGSRRQEAAGNIFQLLGKGVKVFLRNDNNMIHYLKDNGFIVFSFENDFNNFDSLVSLSKEQMKNNQEAFLRLFNLEQEKLIMKKICI